MLSFMFSDHAINGRHLFKISGGSEARMSEAKIQF